ncbi:MAG: DUF1826 domain-containing protein [Sphingopyxis sp.]|nr:DUF1826 domain-containing protein [Sphingopyxis sp.]
MTLGCSDVRDKWLAISASDCPIMIEPREMPLPARDIDALIAAAPFAERATGSVDQLMRALDHLPAALRKDIAELAARFMALMQVDSVRVRVEGVVSNACKTIHADYTDLRLITTYAGRHRLCTARRRRLLPRTRAHRCGRAVQGTSLRSRTRALPTPLPAHRRDGSKASGSGDRHA